MTGLIEPAHGWVPKHTVTAGPEVADLSRLAGMEPDPEQELALDAIFALDRRNRNAAFEVAVVAPRQNLKTGLLKMAGLGKLFIVEQKLIVWSAHEFATARQAFEELDTMIDGCSWLSRRVKRVNYSHGDESIELTSGGVLKFRARTRGGGRGLSGDTVFMDEAYALKPMHIGALMPILSARPDPQIVYASSAGHSDSSTLRDLRDRGRAGGDPSLAYLEWCAPDPEIACAAGKSCDHARRTPGCGCDKPELLELANTAIARGRMTIAHLAKERRSMPVEEFGRERMGWWDEPSLEEDSPIDLAAWGRLVLSDSEEDKAAAEAVPIAAFGLEVDPDRAWTSIGMAGPFTDEQTLVELVYRGRGTAGAVAKCVALDDDHGPVVFVVDGHGPASSLIDDLADAGLQLLIASSADVAEADMTFVDAVNEARVVYPPSPELEEAVNGARRRSAGGDGKFAFGRKSSDVDVTPLKAVSLARWAGDGTYDIKDSILWDEGV